MDNHLFTYGSLTVPIVMQTVTGRTFRHRVGRLRGFDRFMLEGRTYPGIMESAGGSTEGRIYFDIDDEALARLDFFEADEYERKTLDIEVEEGAAVSAFVYVMPSERGDLLTADPWDEAMFVKERLDVFLEQTRQWMAGYLGAT